MNTLSFSRNHYEVTICFAISLWIHYPIPRITMWTFSFSQNHYKFTIFLRFHYEYTIFFAQSIWIHYLLREFTTFFANCLWIHNETTILSIWIYFLFRNFSLDFIFLRELTICFANSLNPISLLWNHYKSTILFR